MSDSFAWQVISFTASVYEKSGLKAGPGITSATFSKPQWGAAVVTPHEPTFTVTRPSAPLGTPTPPIYEVVVRAWRPTSESGAAYPVQVGADSRYYPDVYWVRSGDRFEVRLQRR